VLVRYNLVYWGVKINAFSIFDFVFVLVDTRIPTIN